MCLNTALAKLQNSFQRINGKSIIGNWLLWIPVRLPLVWFTPKSYLSISERKSTLQGVVPCILVVFIGFLAQLVRAPR